MKAQSIHTSETRGQFTKMINSVVAVMICSMAIFMTSCQEDEVAPSGSLPKPTTLAASPVAGGSAVNFTTASTFGNVRLDNAGVFYVENFFQGTPGTGTDPHVPNATYYYRFDVVDGGTSANYALRFGGTANGDVTVASGWTIEYTTVAFSSVTTSTATNAIPNNTFGYNTIAFGAPTSWTVSSTHPGWYNYDVVNHVVYPLVDNGGAVTLVVSNGTLKYKVELQDIYQDGTPNSATPPNNYPYIKFRYQQL